MKEPWYEDLDGEFELRLQPVGLLLDIVAGRDAAFTRAVREARRARCGVELRYEDQSVALVIA